VVNKIHGRPAQAPGVLFGRTHTAFHLFLFPGFRGVARLIGDVAKGKRWLQAGKPVLQR
jgi:hypothetical protein